MPLEKLLLLVETLKARIEKHGDALKGSEALTRYTLIDPLLRALGWDTADPSLVIPEFKSGKGWADYALLEGDGKPAMMIEAKSLGTPLHDEARTKGITYCIALGTKYFALTDGNRWELYETHRPVPIEEKRIVKFDVTVQPTPEACLQALALWRPNLEAGSAVTGHAPLNWSEPAPENQPKPAQPLPSAPDEDEWQPFSVLQSKSGDPPPAEIRFPDDSRVSIKYWKDTVVEVVRWLVNSKHLSPSLCPVQRARTNVVATSPVHPSGSPFRSPYQIGSLHIETHGNVIVLLQRIRAIIEYVDLDAAQFKVRFD